jgi:hypothetical protein
LAGRLNVGPLLSGLIVGLRKRREGADGTVTESPDWGTWAALVVLPIGAGFLMFHFRVRLENADQFLAGAALLAGALLTGFSQIASWRERVLERDADTNASRVRSLNEAAAHVLVAVLGALVVTGGVIALAILDFSSPEFWMRASIVGLGALVAAVVTHIALTVVIVVNLLWDAFEREKIDAAKKKRPELKG